MKILIAGASGYIGGRLSSFLAEKGHEIIALCNSNIPTDESWLRKMKVVLKVDISSYDEVERLSKYDVDVIINLVSLDHHQSNGLPGDVSSVNVLPTWSFLQLFAERSLKKYIYLSTIHVYGNQLIGDIDEDSDVKPINQYGLTHLLSEQIANYFGSTKSIECYNIRFSNGFGAPQFLENKCWDLVINNLCLNAWKDQKLVLKSDGSPLRDFINIQDLLVGINELVNTEEREGINKGKTINFSSSKTITMLEAAFAVKGVYEQRYSKEARVYINEDQLIEHLPLVERENKYCIINTRFESLLAGKQLHDIDYGINEIFEFLESKA